MSEPVAAMAVTGPAPAERKVQAETLVRGILTHMDYPARLELKDMPDGGIGIAMHFENELPGITLTKQRSWLVDCIQFLVNKSINRPNVEKRWVSLGVNSFPEPRPEKQAPVQREAPAPSAPPPAKAAKQKPEAKQKSEKPEREERPQRRNEVDERTLAVKDDPALTKLFKTLAEKSSKTGRIYAVMSLTAEQRALALKAAAEVKGVAAKSEGEGHWRRLTLTPEKLTPMPSKRQVMPDFDDEEE